MPRRVTWRLVEPDPGRDLDVTGYPLVLRAWVIEGEIGVTEMLERLWHLRVAQFLLAHQVRGVREVLVAADVIEVEVRVHHEVDLLRVEPARLQLGGDGLVSRLLR